MSTYPAEHTDTDATEHERAKAILARRLETDHRGRGNAVASKELAEYVTVAPTTVRDLIPQVRAEYDLPIGSANGYFVIDSDAELERQIERQQRQARTSIETARDMAAAYAREHRDTVIE